MLSISNHHNVGNQLYSNIKVFWFLFFFKVKLGWSAGDLSTRLVLDVSGSLSLRA